MIMQKLKVINDKNTSLTLCSENDRRTNRTIIMPSEDAYIRKFYNHEFSENTETVATALYSAGAFLGVFFLLPTIIFKILGSESAFLVPLIVFTAIPLLLATYLYIWREESLKKITYETRHVHMLLAPQQNLHVSSVSDEHILKFYKHSLKMRELRELIDKIDNQSSKNIDDFVREDLKKRRAALSENYQNTKKVYDETFAEIKEHLDTVIDEEEAKTQARLSKQENTKALNLLSMIDELEAKTDGF